MKRTLRPTWMTAPVLVLALSGFVVAALVLGGAVFEREPIEGSAHAITAQATPAPGSSVSSEGHVHGDADGHGAFCHEHDLPESECGICNPELAAVLTPGEGVKVRLSSARSAALAGVRLATPVHTAITAGVQGYAEVDYDRNRLAQITPLVDGVVQRIHVDAGDTVTAGAPLVEIASAQVAAAKQTFLTTRQDQRLRRQELERERRLHEQQIAAERAVQEAETAYVRARNAAAAAEQNLRNLGLDDEAVARIGATGDITARLTIHAPFDGVVIERDATLGEAVEHWASLLRIADLSRMWLELSLPESALPLLRPGLPVTAHFSALPGREIAGELVWIAAGLDVRTRMLRARAEVANPDGQLKAGMYGEAEVALEGAETALAVPLASIRRLEQRPYVFVHEADDLYVLRSVALGGRFGERVAISAGLASDDRVVIEGGYALYTELLKSRLGAGCAAE
jgi:cobalt-zinc-cadmium efflux system membrane fusion protein